MLLSIDTIFLLTILVFFILWLKSNGVVHYRLICLLLNPIYKLRFPKKCMLDIVYG